MLNRSSLFLAGLISLGVVPAVASCNAITGASDLKLTDEDDDSESPPDNLVQAAGVSITAIDLYQGVKRPLMSEGVPATSEIPIIAGRNAMIRVFVSTDASYNGLPVTGRVYIGNSTTPMQDTKTFTGKADESVLESTINIMVPGAKIAPGMTYRVELKQQPGAAPSTSAWRYPATGSEALNVASDGQALKVVLVPVQYAADGSNRLPNTTPEQVQLYKDAFLGFYPIPKVDVTVRSEPLVWDKEVTAYGADAYASDWTDLRDAVGDVRMKDGVAADVYYFGIFNPASSDGAFCGGGCIAGIANLAGPGDQYLRAAIGLGFGGSISTDTAVHEIGHTFGRQHSPCGQAAGPDPEFPYPEGNTGVWGYDLVNKTLFPPETGDVMSYCSPYWVSDYTFMKLFERFQVVNTKRINYPEEMLNRMYARVRIRGDGALSWRTPVKLYTPPVGFETKTVTVVTANGPETVTGQYYPNDHVDGGELLWPLSTSPTRAVKVEFKGQVRTLAQ